MKLLKIVGKIALAIAAGLAVLFMLGYTLTIGDYAVAKTVAEDPSIPHVTIDGVTFHAETFGNPAHPVVVVVHGGPGVDYRTLQSLRALSDHYFVVFYDQRGSGLSPRVDPREITLASALADLNSIVDHYSPGRKVNLVGHSWGAMLTSAYIGKYPEKVDHAVLAEPGFLTSEFAEEFAKRTAIHFSPGALYHFVKTKFEALHVSGPDDHASDDYFANQMNMYQGSDHPQAGDRCEGGGPKSDEVWRYGSQAAGSFYRQAVDANGKFNVSFVDNVDRFKGKVLFMVSVCQKVSGVDWQKRQMRFFPHAELAIIPNSGHEMFVENPQVSIAAVRAYLDAPAG